MASEAQPIGPSIGLARRMLGVRMFAPLVAATTLVLASALGGATRTQTTVGGRCSGPSVAARLAAQTRLLDEQYQADLRASPLTATSYGDHRYDGQLDHFSLQAAMDENAADRHFLARLRAIDVSGFSEEDRTSHDLLVDILRQRIADFVLGEYEMPLSQIAGVHLTLADLPNATQFETVRDYDTYLARLGQIPRALDETITVLEKGRRDGLMPPRFLLEKISSECDGTVRENPFVAPLRRFPATVSSADRARLERSIVAVVRLHVLPSYRRFSRFISRRYAPFGRGAIAVSALPGGLGRYRNDIREQTSTDLSPIAIHGLGLSEVARISALLDALAHKEGFRDRVSYRAALLTDARYIPTSPDAIVEDFRRHIAAMQPKLSEIFTDFRTAPLVVEAIPASQPSNGTHYLPGTADGRRPARIVIATSDFSHRSLITDEVFAYHEGVPGHHVQLTIQQRLTGLPRFRRHAFSAAYGEGWAVYTELVAKEIGCFQDPASDYGRLSTELLRAARLVVDTGIHADGWSRQRAIDYFRSLGVADEPTIRSEVDRYIALPAQSLSYKIGQLKILELRERARRRLGSKFDLRRFHDAVLNGGNLPLDLLEARIDRWLDAAVTTRSGKVS